VWQPAAAENGGKPADYTLRPGAGNGDLQGRNPGLLDLFT